MVALGGVPTGYFENFAGFDNTRPFMRGLVLDAGPAQLLSGRRSEAPGFGASDESAEDWSQADSQSPWAACSYSWR